MDGLAVSILFLVILSFLLFLIRVGLIFYHNILLARELKRIAREAEARRRNNPVVVPTEDNRTNEPPKDDLPPAYDEVIQMKLALQAAAEEGRQPTSGGSNAQSTMTLATFVEASGSSANQSAPTGTTIPVVETNETLPPAYENAVFEHDEIVNERKNENSNGTV